MGNALFSGGGLGILAATFTACAVEMVEISTILVGVGSVRGWRSTIVGAVAGFIVLAVIIGGLGVELENVPIHWLRLVVGSLLLAFGLNWLRKAIAAYAQGGEEEEGAADASQKKESRFGVRDWYAFTLAFKGMLLEGLEIAFIVISFGTSSGNITSALVGGGIAILVIGGIAAAIRGKVEQVPNRVLKFVVGVLLTTFGIFWASKGAFVGWPDGKVALAPLSAVILLVALAYVWLARTVLAYRSGATHPLTNH